MTAPTHRRPRPRGRLLAPIEAAALAAVCYGPLLLGAHGRLNADTKQYLYLDPGGLMERARSLWDTSVGGGAVTHQTIGYLWPMGPYYWLLDQLGVPDWVAQRIWIGSIQLVAALGALVLFRTLLRGREPGHVVAALGYGLSPFLLGHITGQSALVLPFAAFPWMVWALVRGLDDRSWRWPALYALIVTTCGSLNGSSVFFVVLGSVLWIPFGVHTLGRAGARDGVVLLVRAGALTLLTQLWWLVAYFVGGQHGLPILSITETVQATSSTTSAAEVLRGLGYWYFYGGDPHRPWLPDVAGPYMTSPFLLTVSFGVPVVALLLASRLRWSSRAYFAALITIGTLIATISFSSPWRSPAGVAFEETSRRVDIVLSLRNTQRAGPLVVLGIMGLLAAALSALRALRRRTSARVVLALALLVMVALPGQWGGLIAERFHRKDVPAYWYEAGRMLDEGHGNVLELPGIDFASYRWGNTLDPVSVGLTDRPVIARELVPQGGPVGISLLNALDRSLQEGWAEPEAFAPMARLLGASTILVRNDLEYERYRTARPRRVWGWMVDPRAGLGRPVGVGTPVENRPDPARPMVDEIELGMGAGPPIPPIGLFEVVGGDRPPLSTHGTRSATVIEGSGEGFYNAGAAGLLDDLPGALLLGADLAREGAERAAALAGPGARYIITDSNRKQDELWYSLRENVGATEPVDQFASDRDEAEGRIDLVRGMPDGARTTVRWKGADRVWGTDYGGGATLLPEDRPSNAFDGDVATSWRVSASLTSSPTVSIHLTEPSTAPHVDLIQPQARPGSQPVREMTVVLDGERRFGVEIDTRDAFDPDGVRVRLDGEPFRRLDVELTGFRGTFGSAGLAEVRIPGASVREVVQLPTTMLEQLGSDVGSAPLAVVLSRLRADPAEPLRSDPELRMVRELALPGPVTLTLGGTARLRPGADDGFGEELTGTSGPFVRAQEHLPGAAAARGSAAFDGLLATAWTSPFVGIEGQWLEVKVPTPKRFDQIDLDVVADERHSLPRVVSVSVDGVVVERLALPRIERGPLGTIRHLELPLERAVAGRTIRITVEEAEALETNDWYTNREIALPIALAEVTIPGIDPVERDSSIDTGCRDDLLLVDGSPVELRVTGSVAGALAGAPLQVAACDGPIELDAGPHLLETTSGFDSGLDLDRLVLRSTAWSPTPVPAPGPAIAVERESRGHVHGTIADQPGDPFWLVVDQSANDGWRLEVDGVDGERAEVDGPHPVDGNAVGWLVRPAGAGALDVKADWTPGGAVDLALALSAVGAIACLAMVVLARRPDAEAIAPYGPPRLTRGPDVAWRRSLPGAAATAVVAGLCVHPLAAVPAGLAMAVFTSRPRWGRFIPPALIALSALGVVLVQVRDEVPPGGGWPAHFGFAHFFTLIAVLILGSEAVAEATRHRGARLRREAWERARRDAEPSPNPPTRR